MNGLFKAASVFPYPLPPPGAPGALVPAVSVLSGCLKKVGILLPYSQLAALRKLKKEDPIRYAPSKTMGELVWVPSKWITFFLRGREGEQ